MTTIPNGISDPLNDLLSDLAAEGDRLRAAVSDLDEDGWRTPTPAEGWNVATQIAHLAWTDETSVLATRAAAGDKIEWDALVLEAIADPTGIIDTVALAGGAVPPAELLERWDRSRAALPPALRAATGKMPWFGPPMSALSMATARLMETWSHGLDVYDALGIEPHRADSVRHVCHLGVRTRNYSFSANGLTPPTEEIWVELTLPSGEPITWGDPNAMQKVTGSAWDFARLATQRVHRDDTNLQAVGPDAEQWLLIAQAFAGPAGSGRDPQ